MKAQLCGRMTVNILTYVIPSYTHATRVFNVLEFAFTHDMFLCDYFALFFLDSC